jgi:hypothetical protein
MNLMFIKNGGKGKGTFHKWSRHMSFKKSSSKLEGERLHVESPGNLGVKSLGWYLSKVLLGHERGFKILPDNDAKMLSRKM